MRHGDTTALRKSQNARQSRSIIEGGGQIRREFEESWRRAYLDPRVRAVVDEDQGGGDVDNQAEHSDEIGREPEWHFADQPVPPWLQEAVEEAVARTAVLVFAEPLELAGRQQSVLVELHASSGRACRSDAVSPNRRRRRQQQGGEEEDGERERYAGSDRSCDGDATTTRRTITDEITRGGTAKHNKRPSRHAYISTRSADPPQSSLAGTDRSPQIALAHARPEPYGLFARARNETCDLDRTSINFNL